MYGDLPTVVFHAERPLAQVFEKKAKFMTRYQQHFPHWLLHAKIPSMGRGAVLPEAPLMSSIYHESIPPAVKVPIRSKTATAGFDVYWECKITQMMTLAPSCQAYPASRPDMVKWIVVRPQELS